MTDFVTTATGDRVGYDRRGQGSAVVFVAGAGPFRAMDPQTTDTAQLLAGRGYTTVVHDRVGRADSFRPGKVTLEDELAAVARVLEVAGGRAVLVGHSSGCAIALRAAADGLPVDGLVLFEAPLDPATVGVPQWTGELYRLLDADDAAGAVTHYMKDIPLEILEGMRDSPVWEPFVAHAQSLRADAEALEWAMSAPHADLFGTVGVPVVVVVGEETFAEMPAAAASLASALPDVTRATVAGAQHSWDPPAMADLIASFVEARTATGRGPTVTTASNQA